MSNLGMYGVQEFFAIINPPQSAILAVGAGRPAAAVVDGPVRVETQMALTLSADHRAIDGALAPSGWLRWSRPWSSRCAWWCEALAVSTLAGITVVPRDARQGAGDAVETLACESIRGDRRRAERLPEATAVTYPEGEAG